MGASEEDMERMRASKDTSRLTLEEMCVSVCVVVVGGVEGKQLPEEFTTSHYCAQGTGEM